MGVMFPQRIFILSTCLFLVCSCSNRRKDELSYRDLLRMHDENATEIARHNSMEAVFKRGATSGEADTTRCTFVVAYPDDVIFEVTDVRRDSQSGTFEIRVDYSDSNAETFRDFSQKMEEKTGVHWWSVREIPVPTKDRKVEKLKKGDTLRSRGWLISVNLFRRGDSYHASPADSGAAYRNRKEMKELVD